MIQFLNGIPSCPLMQIVGLNYHSWNSLITLQEIVQLLILQVSFTVYRCTGDCTTAYFTGIIYSKQMYRRLYNCLLYRYHLQYIDVQETVQLLTLQVSFTVHSCTGYCTTSYSTGTNYGTQPYRRLYNCLLYRYQLQYIAVQEPVELLILQVSYTLHSCTGYCTTAYSTGIIYSNSCTGYYTTAYSTVSFTVHICTRDCTTAYSTGIIYVTYLYRRLYNCLLYRYHLQYIAVQDTVQLLTLQVSFTVYICTGDCTTAYCTGILYLTWLYRKL